MKRSLIIYFSDIHLTGERPENEGKVVNAFCDDVKKQLFAIPHEDVFVLIGGDLVQAADDADSYDLFWEKILCKLISYGVNKKNIICVPGNHDAQRGWVEKNKDVYGPFISRDYNEGKFNDLVNGNQANLFTEKFGNYSNFVLSRLDIQKYDVVGFPVELNDEWSVYCLNSALSTFTGLESDEYPQLKDDTKRLNIDTRRLYEWLELNSKKKILLMHHPMDFLTEHADVELKKLVKLNFDIVLTGHTHRQDLLCNHNGNDSYIWCQAPQLYTDKHDKLGYCMLELCGNDVERIIYREWFGSRNSFRAGLDFTEEEDGIIRIDNKRTEVIDPIRVKLEERFKDTMAVYGDSSLVWVDRYFSLNRFDRTFRFNKNDLYSEDEIMDAHKSIKILTPAQYGLTSFAWHFLLRLWKEKKEFGLYIDCGLIKHGKIEKTIARQLNEFGIKESNVKWLLFDNWDLSNKDAKQILSYVSKVFPSIPIMILCPMLEKSFVDNENISNMEFAIVNMYMAPMQMAQLRTIVDVYNAKRNIGESELILKRLNEDIQNFNMHRTPLNCISLLEVFSSSSFDENPVNRTAMVEKLLRIIFENETVPSYKSLPDVKDCEFAIGFYCEQMIRGEGYYFNSQHFYDTIAVFCKKQKITLDIHYLFDILLNNQIICQYDQDLYGFRFTFWVYYFAAMRMTKSEDFAKFILSQENYLHYPEILEFYTGSDRTRNDAADIVKTDIQKVSDCVHKKVGIPEGMNPFKMLRLQTSDEQVKKAISQLDDNLQKSRLPNNIKDALADKEYNPSTPFHQEVRKVWESYSVNYLQEMICVASKTLRNSDYINPELKEQLFIAITEAWYNTIRVVYLMAPALAYEGKAGYDDFRLQLSESYQQYKDNPQRLLINVISNIPLNILKWYKDDIYSSKLADLLFDRINNESNKVIKHILVSLTIYEQPERWNSVVEKYLAEEDRNSFYFADTISALETMYANGVMSEQNIAKTRNLIFLAYTKLASKDNRLRPGDVRWIKKDVLPERRMDDD